MKIIHTSDWHLGRMLYGKSLLSDQRHFLQNIFLPVVEREGPAIVIIAGDIYDRQVAPTEAIRLFDDTLSVLLKMKIPTAFISGNHDSPDRITIMKSALRSAGVYVSTSLADAFQPVELHQGDERIQLFLLPYLDNAAVRDYFQDETPKGEQACMRRVLEELKPLMREDCAKILAAHCFVAGSEHSDSESTIFAGGSAEIPASLFEDFDYVALGHLHGPQRAGGNGRYSGSPLKYSVDEQHQKKSFVMLDVRQGSVRSQLVPINPLRDVRRITGLFEQILTDGQAQKCEDYVELILEDQNPVMLAAEKLRPCYPNLLSVRNNWAAASVALTERRRLKNETEQVIFQSFMKDICDVDSDEGVRLLFEEVLREAVREEDAK